MPFRKPQTAAILLQGLIDRLVQIGLYVLPFEKKQYLISVIVYSALNSEINIRETLHKSFSEVKSDSDFFRKIARQADSLLCRPTPPVSNAEANIG